MLQIEIKDLNKKYGKKKVLNNINITLSNDTYNIIVGANASGKSTLVKCINGVIDYDGFINNHEYVISYCPDKVIFPEFISLNNFLYLLEYCSTKRISDFKKKIDYYLELFKLQEFKNTPIIKLSLGSKQKILIIQALIKDADVYIFDEPLNGLDNESQKVFIDELKRLKEEEKLILIITHNISKYPLVNINQIDLNYAWTN